MKCITYWKCSYPTSLTSALEICCTWWGKWRPWKPLQANSFDELKTILVQNHYSGFSWWLPMLPKASWVDIAANETDLVSQPLNRQCLLLASWDLATESPLHPELSTPSSCSSNRELSIFLKDPYTKSHPFSAHTHLYYHAYLAVLGNTLLLVSEKRRKSRNW